ncbi:MAG: biotin/lipoyl-binding protein [Chloroflexota bacterium]|nr:biotin/lipoyl-binding protein [Chloroflexota bacterium]
MAAKYRLRLGDEQHEVEVEPDYAGGYRVLLGDAPATVSLEQINDSARYSLIVDGKTYDVFAEEGATGYHVIIGGRTIAVDTQTGKRKGGPESQDLGQGGEWVLKSPMAGVVREVHVKADDEVAEGQLLIIVEAMKMQNELHARRAGQVKAVYVSSGQRVDQSTPLIVLV